MFGLLRRVLLRLLGPRLDEMSNRVEQLERLVQTVDGTLAATMASLVRHVETLGRDAASTSDSTGEYLQDLTAAIQHIQRRLEEIAVPLAGLEAIPWMSDPEALLTSDELGRQTIGFARHGCSDDALGPGQSYRAFEDLFRGSEDLIRERQGIYLDYLKDAGLVVDLGCGRGEMLDLLDHTGVKGIGVDLDEGMILRCRAKGNQVVHENALTWLRSQEDGSISHIFSAQFVEHLEYADLIELLGLSLQKLRPGGRMITETVNPHSVGAWKTFWVDPTHKVPLFPESLTALFQGAGYASAFVLFPNGTGLLAKDRSAEGEYAVIATAPG